MGRRGGRGASNASARQPAASGRSPQRTPPPPPPIQPVDANQFDKLAQQVQNLTAAVQRLQERTEKAAQEPPPHPPQAQPCRPDRAPPSRCEHRSAPPSRRSRLSPDGKQRRGHHSKPEEQEPPQHACSGRADQSRERSLSPLSVEDSREEESFSSRCSSPYRETRSMDRRFEELNWKIQALEEQALDPLEGYGTNSQTALSSRILRTPNPPGFKMPAVEPYDGSTDPRDHVDGFKAFMLLHGAPDAVMCKAFPATLRGPARSWFSGLESGLIRSFDQFARLFNINFV